MNQRRTHECLKRRRIEIIDLTSSKTVIETINLCNEDSEEESSLVSVPGRSLSSTSSICHNSVRLHSKAHIPIHQSSDDRLGPLERLNAMLQFNGSDEVFCREFDVLPKHLEYYKIIRDCMSKLGLTHIDLKGNPFQCCVCLDVVCKATSFACEGKHTCCKTCHDNMFKLCFEEAKGTVTRKKQIQNLLEGPKAKCPMCKQTVKMLDSILNPLVDDIIESMNSLDKSILLNEGYEVAIEL